MIGGTALQKRLTRKQKNVAFEIVFGEASVKTDEILEKHGVSAEQFAAWLDGEFAEYLMALSERVSVSESARIMHALAEESKNGDVRSAKLFFELLRDRQKAADAANPDREDIDRINMEIRGDGGE